MTKRISEIKVEHRVHSQHNEKWMLRGRDIQTKKLGILVCMSINGEPASTGTWMPLTK